MEYMKSIDKTLQAILSKEVYYIDFYQREYVWKTNIVKTLLDDITYHFKQSYKPDVDITEETINKYNWYYLNICLINKDEESGKQYIVDGQQRLTTLCLIAVKLYHLLNTNPTKFDALIDNIKECIFTKNLYKGSIYLIDNDKRKNIMDFLFTIKEPEPKIKAKGKEQEQKILTEENKEQKAKYEPKTITEKNILERFGDISKYLNKFLYIDSKKQLLDEKKLEAFTLFFLQKLILIKAIINQKDTPMVFEVINDRGIALKPFEILKGKLLGVLDKDDIETYNDLWEQSLNKISDIEDEFFQNYIKAKYIYTKNSTIETQINKEYHRYIFDDNDIAKDLKFRREDSSNIENIKKFITTDLQYYSKLYGKITSKSKYEFVDYNKEINDLKGQYQNIMSACEINDINEEEKIKSISYEIDRMYMLLQLNGFYQSNEYTEIQYNLNKRLKGVVCEDYRKIFNSILVDIIKEKTDKDNVETLLDYNRFTQRGYNNFSVDFLRYFFARVEQYLCKEIGREMIDDIYNISMTKKYHREHILSKNEENKSYFKDEQEFENERNRIGGLLLLYGRDNESSGNELYSDKLKTYSNSFIWAQTLTPNWYHSNKQFDDFNSKFEVQTGIKFEEIKKFDKDALEYRSKLLFEIVKQIWTPEI